MLDGKDLVHAFEAQAALPIQEVGDMGLFESGLLCQTEAGQIACIDALPKYSRRLSCRTLNFMPGV